MMKWSLFISLLPIVCCYLTQAQNSVSNQSLGFQFDIPAGWDHRDLQNGSHIFGHQETPGVILVIPHDYQNMEEVKSVVQFEGIYEEEIQLVPISTVQYFLTNGLKGLFEGYMNGEKVKAAVFSLFAPQGGGLSIFAFTSADKFNETYSVLGEKIATSVVFSEPIKSESVRQWQGFLADRKLTYYKTTDETAVKMIFILYKNGWFRFFDESFYGTTDVYTDHTYSFSSLVTEQNAGRWDIEEEESVCYLILNYNDGSHYRVTLSFKEDSQSQILLSGKRFFTESFD